MKNQSFSSTRSHAGSGVGSLTSALAGSSSRPWMSSMTILVAVCLCFGITNSVNGQLLQWNTFGNLGTETTEPSVFNATGIAASNLVLSTGVTPAANGNRLGGNDWFDTGNTNPTTLAESVADGDYIEFTVTPSSGYVYTPTALQFVWDRSGTGPDDVTLRSSVDGYISDIGSITGIVSGAFANNSINLSSMLNVATAVTFRLYGYGGTSAAGTGGFDVTSNTVNVSLLGTATCMVQNTSTSIYYCSLQSAINAASANDVIELLADITEGQVTINTSLTIDGNGFTLTSTSPNYGVEVDEANVTITNLTIEDAGTIGLQVNCDAHNLILTNVTVDDSGNSGVGINGSDNALITNLTSSNNTGNGISITDCNNTTINGIATFGNAFISGFSAGIGLFTSGVYCPPAGINGFALNGTVSISEPTKVYSQKVNASHVITGITGSSIAWAVGIGALDRSYWLDKSTAYGVVDALFEAPYNYPNTLVYVAEVATENFYVEDDPASDPTPPMLIQTAVTFAVPGKTIFLETGTFSERVTLDKSLTVDGSGMGASTLDGTGLAGVGSGIRINTGITNVTIKDLTVRDYAGSNPNSYAGIYAVGNNNNLTVTDVDLADNIGGSGFYANGPVNNVLLNNVDAHGHTNVSGAARGIVIWNGHKSNITITNCEVYNNNCCGIELQDGSSSAINISDNNVHDNWDNGIGIVGMDQTTGNNLVDDNTLTNNGRFGIEIKNPDGNGVNTVISDNVVTLTTSFAAARPGEVRDLAGIAVFRRGVTGSNVDVPAGVQVTNNTVSGYVQDAASVSEGFGLVIEGINHTATGNTITGNDVGLQQQSGHTPYPGDGNQNNVADTYFGRGNSPMTCGNTLTSNTVSSNTVNTRDVNVGGGLVINTNTSENFCSIQSAINDVNTVNTHVISAAAGTYSEDVVVNKSLTIQGAGIDQSYVIGPIGGGGATFQVSASGVIIDGFTISRSGNNVTDWNNAGLNSPGIAIQGLTVNAEIRNNKITGNRTGIDINNSTNNNIHNNIITFNRTGLIFRNQTDNTDLVENDITDNWTVGVLFLDASGGTNVPVQSALFSDFNDNNISGNWYGEVVDRQAGGSIPPPGSNLKDFECNWYGSVTPWVSTASSSEPGYSAQIPVAYGGSAVAPGGQPDILGVASANIDYVPYLVSGTDSNGTEAGFQPAMGSCSGTPVVLAASSTAETCAGNNGSITTTFSGGTSPYDVAWAGPDPGSINNVTSPYIITTLSAGSYTITVTDDIGTTSTVAVAVNYHPVTNTSQSISYATIQAAVNAANASDAIVLCAGNYVENVIVDESVSITGAGIGLSNVYPAISDPNCGGAGGGSLCAGSSNVFLIQAHNVTLSALTVDGNNTSISSATLSNGIDVDARNGIITNHTAGVFNNLNVNNVEVKNIFLRGMYASSGGTFNFANNTVTNVAGNASSIAMFNFGGAGSYTNNTVSQANDGIASNWSTGTTYTGNLVTACGSGIHTDNNGGSGGVADVIQNNTVTNSTVNGYGIWVFAPYRNVQVLDNTVTNVDVGLANAGQQAAVTASFLGNTVDGMNKSNSTGVYQTTSLFGFGTTDVTGIYTNNFIRNNTDAFYLEYEPAAINTITVSNNSITGNNNGVALANTGGTLTENFQCNWWGSAAAAAVASAAANSVNYTPWLTNGTDNQPGTPGFQPVGGSCGGNPVVIATAVASDATCATPGTIQVTFSGGTAPYNIAWTGGSSMNVSSPYTINGLTAGAYGITVTDNNGSTDDAMATVNLLGVENITTPGFYATIQAAINAANNNDVLEVCASTYTENITVNKPLTINGPNAGTAGNVVRVAEAVLFNCNIDVTAAGTVVLDGLRIYQTDNNSDVVLISGGTIATVQNCILDRDGVTTGNIVRAITTSAGVGIKTIQNNLFTGDKTGGLFGGHKTWNSGMFVNGAASTVNISNNYFEYCRTALNLDDFNNGIVVSGNTLDSCGTFIAFGGPAPTNGQYVFGANNFKEPVSAFINLSNVNPAFRLNMTSSTFNGAAFNTLPLATLFQVESLMYHRGRSGRNGLVYVVANNQYVVSGLTTIQSSVDYAASGDNINVNAGTYNEAVTVNLPVKIDGGTANCADVVIEGGSVRLFGVRVLAGIQNVTLRDFKVQNTVGTDAGIWAATGNNGLNLQNLCLVNTSGTGAILAAGPVNGITINGCEVSGAGVNGRGIVIWDGFKENIAITNNNVHDIGGCCGIELQDGSASGVTMTGNTVTNIGDSGMSAVGLTGSTGNNTISNNIITNTGRFGLEIKNPDGDGTDILINNNTVSLTLPFSTLKPLEERDIAGIAVFRRALTGSNVDVPTGVDVTNNTVSGYIQDNVNSTSEGFGIVIEGTFNTVTGNTTNGNDIGLQQQAGHLPYPGDGDQSDLADLYFGRGNSPTTCGNLLNLNSGSGNAANYREVGIIGGLVTNTTSTETFCTIQAAIDDAQTMNGHTLVIGPGTYPERVNLNKQLILDGAGAGSTILDGTGLPGNGNGITITNGTTNVTIKELTIRDYAGLNGNSNAGIYAIGGNNNLTVLDVDIADNVGGSGFYANGPINNVMLNNVDAHGHTSSARGIVIWNGHKSNITIQNCEVYNNNCCGIELQDGSASGVTLFNNNVHDNFDNGIGLVGLDNTTGNNLVDDNQVINNGRFGIEIKNPNSNGTNTVISDNTVQLTSSFATLRPSEFRDIAGIAVFRRGLTGGNVDVPNGVQVLNNIVSGYIQDNGSSVSEGFGIVIEGTNHTATGNTVSNNDIGLQQQSGHTPYPGDGNQANIADTYFGRGNSPMTCSNTVAPNTYVGNGTSTRNILVGGGIVTNTNTMETFCSIQSAIDDVNTLNTHTLLIEAGTYNENVVITKELTLTGAGSGSNPATNTVLSAASACGGIAFTVNAANVTIQNMYVTNYQDAVQLNGVVNPTLNNLALVDYCRYGINLTGVLNTSIDITNTNITRTSYLANTIGFRAGTATGVNGFVMNNCSITGNMQGSFIAQSTTPSLFDNITIQNSTISNNTQKGLYFEKLSNALLQNLTMDNNGTDAAYGFNNGIDINLKYDDYANITISNCDITNSGANGTAGDPQNAAAVAIKARDDAPSYNTIPASLTGLTVLNNRITGPQNGIRFGEFGKINEGPANVTVEGNDLSFAFAHKAIIRRTNDNVNLVCNWHGSTSLPVILATIADAGSGSTILSSILTSGGDANVAVGFQPSGTCGCASGNLVTNTNSSETFCTLQAAIDDPQTDPGDIILVGPGTYIENIFLTKPLQLRGNNYGINPNTGSRIAESIIVPKVSDPDPNSLTASVILYMNAAATGSVIDGFSFDGDNTNLTSAVNSHGANIDAIEAISGYDGTGQLTISNNIIQNLSYAGIDMYNFTNGGGVTINNTITENKIDNIRQSPYGIGVLIYNNFYAQVDDNVITRVRVGVQTGNFSAANTGATASISNNDIESERRSIFHNLAYGAASAFTINANDITTVTGSPTHLGISLSSLGGTVGAVITNNNIDGAYAGVDFWNCTSTSTITVTGGNITDCDYGVVASNFDGFNSNANSGTGRISGVNISGSDIAAVHVKDNPSNSNNATIALTIDSDCEINGTGQLLTGVLVTGPQATATVQGNDSSINGFAIGIDVDGGVANINNNHIYDNGIGIRFINGGMGNANTNKFFDALPNGTDIEVTASAGGVTATPDNWFAGSAFGVTNASPLTVDASASYWNHPSGPGPVGPGSGANVSTNVLYCPWLGDEPTAFGGTGLPLSSPLVSIGISENSGLANNDGIICNGTVVTLNATTPGAISYLWSTTETTPTIMVSPASTTMYTVTVTFAGCTDDATVTITVNPIPVVSGPSSVCVGSTIQMLPSSGGTWTSSNDSRATITNAGVVTGVSPGLVTFTYTDNSTGCSNTSSPVTVLFTPDATISTALVVVSGTPNNPASIPDAGGGATYVWSVSTGSITAGQGTSSILYTAGPAGPLTISVTVTHANGCSAVGTANVNVINAGPSSMQWVPDNAAHGSCGAATNCCTDVICFGLQYTPGVTGNLTSYTTGFVTNCLGAFPGFSPINSNVSCVMTNNSFEINACMVNDSVLFNSSGNAGMLPVVANTPVILHKVCFNLSPGDVIGIVEDVFTNLSASVDLTGGGQYTEFPAFTTTNLSKPLPVIPGNVNTMVACTSMATLPVPPVVLDYCGNNVPVALTSTVNVPNPIICEGTRTYNFTYTDCSNDTYPWSYTYTVEVADFSMPADDGSTVACIGLANAPTPPMVNDNCGVPITPTGPTVTGTYDGCEGTRIYTWNYADCENNNHNWVYTYLIEVSDFSMPADDGTTVACIGLANAPAAPPVNDFCGNPITPTGPVQGGTYDGCEGTRTFTYTYEDCEGNEHDWVYTYTIEVEDFSIPGNDGMIVNCIAAATQPIPPVVNNNCGFPITPTGPLTGGTYVNCEGTRTYTWNYADCEGNNHNWVYTYTIEVEDFSIPGNDGMTVNCIAAATQPLPPVVNNNCGFPITPTGPMIGGTYAGCEGTRTYTWNYADCENNNHDWVYTYTIEVVDFSMPANSGSTVQCASAATPPIPPMVNDNCGNPIMPTPLPNSGTYAGCEGTIIYTWNYADCEGNNHNWVYTYMIDRTTVPFEVGGPASTGSTIDCPADAMPLPMMALPVMHDACGNPLTPSAPVVGGTNTGGCTGTITYTYTYTDCSGLQTNWVYTYTVSCNALNLRVFLEGPYNSGTGLMNLDLNLNHVLPGQDKLLSPNAAIELGAPFTPFGQPYNTAPWNYNGNTGMNYGDASSPGAPMTVIPYPVDVVDWVLVTVRKNGLLPANNLWTCAGWVHNDGEVSFPESCGALMVNPLDNHYILIQHRNHLGVLTPMPADELCGGLTLEWDFTTGNSYQPVFRFGQKQVVPGMPGVWAMFEANGEQITSINAISSPDRTTWRLLQNALGYTFGDYNMNASTTSGDETEWKDNQNKTSGIIFY